MTQFAIALIASVIPLAAMAITFWQRSGTDYQSLLKEENNRLTRELETCRRQREDMQQENLRLMRMLLQNGKQEGS